MMTMNIWDDISKYKKCQKKQYDIHVCMPPKNTVVINKLEQADTVKILGGRTYFTVSELSKMKSNCDNRFNIIQQAVNCGKAYLVNDNTPFVLAGSLGELWTISAQTLANKYSFLSNNQPVAITQMTLNQRLVNGNLDWTVVRTKPNNVVSFACFVPVSQKGQIQTSWGAVLNINGAGVSHGKGDFVIAGANGNQPNLDDRYVVNGDIFATTYDNRGWADCINMTHQKVNLNISELPKLCEDTNTGFISKDMLDKLCKRLAGSFARAVGFKLVEEDLMIKSSYRECTGYGYNDYEFYLGSKSNMKFGIRYGIRYSSKIRYVYASYSHLMKEGNRFVFSGGEYGSNVGFEDNGECCHTLSDYMNKASEIAVYCRDKFNLGRDADEAFCEKMDDMILGNRLDNLPSTMSYEEKMRHIRWLDMNSEEKEKAYHDPNSEFYGYRV